MQDKRAMSKRSWLISIGVFLTAVIAGAVLFKGVSSHKFSDSTEVDWRLLGELDYITGETKSSELKNLDGKSVKIPGFMVPLEDNMKSVTTFLLVPSPQACIHVPPPPPNQMVLVEMDETAKTEVAFGPIWVYGIFEIHSKRTMYGEASFVMKGKYVEPYR
jgi:hypothetical protein